MSEREPVIGEAWIRGDVPEGTGKQQITWILNGPTPWNACRIMHTPGTGGLPKNRVRILITHTPQGRPRMYELPLADFLAEWRLLENPSDDGRVYAEVPRG